ARTGGSSPPTPNFQLPTPISYLPSPNDPPCRHRAEEVRGRLGAVRGDDRAARSGGRAEQCVGDDPARGRSGLRGLSAGELSEFPIAARRSRTARGLCPAVRIDRRI